MSNHRFSQLLTFGLIILVSLIILWPMFHLALVGDDFLGLWRYQYYLDGYLPVKWNNFSFLFTDYGPQDSLFALIQYLFGFNPFAFYLINFILRMLAAFSIYLLTKKLTGRDLPAYWAMLFFAISVTGLETTNWSFNMPSYLAITFLNLFIISRLNLINHFSWRRLMIIYGLFSLSIFSQPIRMTFMPIFALLLEFGIYLTHQSLLKRSLLLASGYILIFIAIIVFGSIGNSVGAGESFQTRIIDQGWTKLLGNNLGNVTTLLTQHQYQVLLYPIAQIGNLFFPDQLIPFSANPIASQGGKLSLYLLSIVILIISLASLWYRPLSRKFTLPLSIAALGWTILIWDSLIWRSHYPITTGQLISFLIGGDIIILMLLIFLPYWRHRQLLLSVMIAGSLILLGFITPWLRNPFFLFETTGRYLIVPAAGVSLLFGLLVAQINQTRIPLILVAGLTLLFSLQVSGTHQYLSQLATYRDATHTESIRQSIPFNPQFLTPDEPMIYYFEPENSQTLYHSLLFGFPLFIGARFNIHEIWHIAYTDHWNEVVSAYQDGQVLKRFSIPVKPVRLDHIYSYRLSHDQLIDTTTMTRQKLQLLAPTR